jgi:hypothetical protein
MKAESKAGDIVSPLPDPDVAFIFGIAPEGLTPFECLLNGRAENEAIAFHVAGSEAGLFFGHVVPAFDRWFEGRDEVSFNVTIVAIETPTPRDVIKAMAETAAHGHGAGCDGGCGCG